MLHMGNGDASKARCYEHMIRLLRAHSDLAGLQQMLTGPTPEAEEEYGRACEDYETNVAILLEMLRRDLTDGQAWRPAWRPISSVPEHKTVLLYRKPDLYPIVGSSMGDDFILEEGGPEDDEERQYPFLRYKPTHWAELPETPL